MCTGGVGNLLARDRAAAAAAAAVLLVRALDGLAPLLPFSTFLVLPEVDASGVLGPGAGVVLVELPDEEEGKTRTLSIPHGLNLCLLAT